MHNGNTSPGHDIGPAEVRLPMAMLNSQHREHQPQQAAPNGMVPIEVISGYHEDENGEMEVEYERVFVQRPTGGVFFEPLDEGPGDQDSGRNSAARLIRPGSTAGSLRQLYSEAARLATFEGHWSEEYPVRPQDLAREGLFYLGPGDKVKCAFCTKTLRGWEPGDVVEQEHKRIYPNCPFVLGRCEGMNKPLQSPESMQHSYGVKVRDTSKETDPMGDMTTRLRTFDTRWPPYVPVSPRLIAEAGMFYTGDKDKTMCFQCRKLLRNWEAGDDPWREHARLSPECPYVLSVKGKEFVEDVINPGSPNSFPTTHEAEQWGASALPQPPVNGLEPAQPQETRQPIQVSESSAISEQMSRLQIDDDMRSPAVLAFQECFEDVPTEQIRQLLERIRLTKGSTYKLSSKDLAPLIGDT